MSDKKVRFYLAFNSPYSFLGSTRIDEAIAPFGAELEYRPIYRPATSGGPDIKPEKLQYMRADVQRSAKAYGLALNPGPFADTGKACIGFFFAEEKGRAKAYRDAVYGARWLEGKDLSKEETLGEVAEKCGLDRKEFLAALEAPKYREALDRSNKEGEADGVFGFPFFIYKGEKFWGNDRIEWLVKALEADKG